MIKELIIHLGDTKTGSTSIQQTLAHGLVEAEGRTLLYPTSKNHTRLALTFIRDRFAPGQAGRFRHLHRVFSESDADIGIISSEYFQFVDPQELHDVMARYWPDLQDRVRLVAWVRPHVSKFLSAFSQRVKQGKDLSITSIESDAEKTFASSRFDYMPRFARWREVFGDRFVLRPFVRAYLHEGDVVRDFFHVILKGGNFRITKEVETNRSLTMSQLALLHHVHHRMCRNRRSLRVRDSAPREARMELNVALSRRLQRDGPGEDGRKPALPADLVEAFQRRYRADAEALDAAFFEGTPMSDALAAAAGQATTEAQPLEIGHYFAPETVRAVEAFADLLGMLIEVEPETLRRACTEEKWGLAAGTAARRAKRGAGRKKKKRNADAGISGKQDVPA